MLLFWYLFSEIKGDNVKGRVEIGVYFLTGQCDRDPERLERGSSLGRGGGVQSRADIPNCGVLRDLRGILPCWGVE